MKCLFAYGSLQLPDVMQRVTGHCFQSRPARLDNYVRRKLRGEDFPGIRPFPGTSVHGLCFLGLDDQSLERLDEYEGDYYQRETVGVITTVEEARLEAEIYVLCERFYDLLLLEDWDIEAFRRNMLCNRPNLENTDNPPFERLDYS